MTELKQTLMELGNRLVTEHRFNPGHIDPRTINAVVRRRSTETITLFTAWLNATPEAQAILKEMGIDWRMPVGKVEG